MYAPNDMLKKNEQNLHKVVIIETHQPLTTKETRDIQREYFNETFIKTLSRQSQIVTPAIQTGKRFAPRVLEC